MSDPLTKARARLAGFETLRLIVHGPQDDGTYLLCLDDEADTDVARVWGTDPTCGLALARLLGNAPTDLRTALAEVDRLTREEAAAVEQLNALAEDNDRLDAARAVDVARIAAHVRAFRVDASAKRAPWGLMFRLIADAIERGDWRDAPPPPDPRDARIAALEAEVASLRAVADTVTGVRDA